MKAFYTLLSLLLFFSSEAVTTYAGFIGINKLNNTKIEVEYNFVLDQNDTFAYADSIISYISCSNSNLAVKNITESKRIEQFLDCARTIYKWNIAYKVLIDLDDSYYSILKGCCNLSIDATLGKRSQDITNLATSQSRFYVFSEFENCKFLENQTPVSVGSLYNYVCIDKLYYYSGTTVDPTEFDSISYELVAPRSARNTLLTYKQGYSLNQPFRHNGLVFFEFDSVYGDFSYWPDNVYDAGPINYVIKEWRYDPSGSPYLISTTVKEIYIRQNQCPGNNPPIINGPYSLTVCEGNQLCFNITTNDLPFIPPPPAPIPPLDTVKLTWNQGIPGATFTILDPTLRLKTGRFCWTPPQGAASSLPYTFLATVRDNACPFNAITTRSYRITVKPKAIVKRQFERINDTMVSINVRPTQNAKGIYSYNISLLDKDRNPILDNTLVRFKSTGIHYSVFPIDTLILLRSGVYIVQTNTNNGVNCPSVNFDTLYYHTASTKDIATGAIKIYPNPTKDLVHLDETMDQIRVYDLLGNQVLALLDTNTIKVKHLPNGVFVIRASRGYQVFSTRFIKQ